MATVLQRDITYALHQLREARTARDDTRIDLFEQKVNRLLDEIPRRKTD